jgi:hypothetical protein
MGTCDSAPLLEEIARRDLEIAKIQMTNHALIEEIKAREAQRQAAIALMIAFREDLRGTRMPHG